MLFPVLQADNVERDEGIRRDHRGTVASGILFVSVVIPTANLFHPVCSYCSMLIMHMLNSSGV